MNVLEGLELGKIYEGNDLSSLCGLLSNEIGKQKMAFFNNSLRTKK